MNYGAEPADQVVRYSLEGTEYAIKLTGLAAKNFAVFVAAVLKDSQKTHGKTKLARLLKVGKPLKFFSVPVERMREFTQEANLRGLLFVPIRDKLEPDKIEIAVWAEDAAKVNRVIERMQLDVVEDGTGEIVESGVAENAAAEPDAPQPDIAPDPQGFALDEDAFGFDMGFTPAPQEQPAPGRGESPSVPSLPNKKFSPKPPTFHAGRAARTRVERPSVRLELGAIKALLLTRKQTTPLGPQIKKPIKISRSERGM